MNINKVAAILLMLLVFDVITVAGTMSYQRILKGRGKLKKIGIEAYWDEANTQIVSTLDWGTVEPSEVKILSFYVRSMGNSPSTLSMRTENWNPLEASDFIMISWDVEGISLNVGDQVLVNVTLSTSPSIVGIIDFAFDVVLEAQG